jgi:hypothetical protein
MDVVRMIVPKVELRAHHLKFGKLDKYYPTHRCNSDDTLFTGATEIIGRGIMYY